MVSVSWYLKSESDEQIGVVDRVTEEVMLVSKATLVIYLDLPEI